MKGKPNPRRAELKALSAELRPMVKAGVYSNVNEGLVELYSTQTGQRIWHTFKGWLDTGFSVRKGESGFPIWAQPRPMTGKEKPETQPADVSGAENPAWFPVCYLFHAGQVQEIEQRQAA